MVMTNRPDAVDVHVGSRVRMRRMMLGMSQGELAAALGLSFQQVQKYEKGSNRMGASRLQKIAHILQVPVTFFFDGAPGHKKTDSSDPSPAYISEFLGTSDGLALVKSFMLLPNVKLRKSIVALVERIAGDD